MFYKKNSDQVLNDLDSNLTGLSKEEAKNKAYNFKKFHSIEYFSREDLEIIVADIKTKIIEYFAK